MTDVRRRVRMVNIMDRMNIAVGLDVRVPKSQGVDRR
jgi:hypothetical protein